MTDFDLKVFNFFNLGIKPTINPKEITANPGYISALILLVIAVGTTFLTTSQMMPKQPETKVKIRKPPIMVAQTKVCFG